MSRMSARRCMRPETDGIVETHDQRQKQIPFGNDNQKACRINTFNPATEAPTDGERPGDAELFAGLATRAVGDHAPEDREAPGDAERLDQAFREQQEPLGGIAGIHFSAPFIRRPVATFLLSIAILLAGCGGV